MQRQANFYSGAGGIEGSAVIQAAAVSDGVDLLGKQASDLMSGVAVEDDTITGTLHYVTGYTGFNEAEPEEQEGYFLALIFTAEGYNLSVSHSGGKHPDEPVPLDPDGIYILRVESTGQVITVVAEKDGDRQSRSLTLAVTLEEKGD